MGWLTKLFSKTKQVVVRAIDKVKAAASTITKNISNSLNLVKATQKQIEKTVTKGISQGVEKAQKAVERYADSWKETVKKSVENAHKKVFDIEPEIGTVDLIAAITPIGSVEAGLGKIGAKGFISMLEKEAANAIKIFKGMGAKFQLEFLNKLISEKGGVEAIQTLLKSKALDSSIAKPAVQAVNKKIADEILAKKFPPLIEKLIAALGGRKSYAMIAITAVASAMGLNVWAAWPATDNIATAVSIDYRQIEKELKSKKKTPEEALKEMAAIRIYFDAAKKYLDTSYAVNPLIRFLMSTFKTNADLVEHDIEEIEETAKKILKETPEIPETLKGKVREITDGDTIRVEWKNPQTDETVVSDVRLVGINAPEKSEKGYAESKGWLNSQLWGREVTLGTDKSNLKDVYDRILAVVFLDGQDINLKSLENGWSMTYFFEPHRLVSEATYRKAELKAQSEGVGIWALVKEYGSIGVSSKPTHAEIFLDGEDTGLKTAETLKDIEPGEHKIKLTLSDYKTYVETVKVMPNKKVEIYAVLEKKIAAAPPAEGEEEPAKSGWPEYPDAAVDPGLIPSVYTSEQEWALQEAFAKIEALVAGRAVMSEAERIDLMNQFLLYTDEQKLVLNLLWQDVAFLEKGSRQMSAEEFNNLKVKYRI